MIVMIKMVVGLSIICARSGFALSYLKASTAPKIEEQVLTYVQSPAIASVFQYAENDPLAERLALEVPANPDTGEAARRVIVFPYWKDGSLAGVALENFGKGYGGNIGVMVGFNISDDTIIGIGVTTMSETPGIGTRILEPSFTSKFQKKDSKTIELTSSGGNIDSLGGATISSAGVVKAVQNATSDYTTLKDQIITAFKK